MPAIINSGAAYIAAKTGASEAVEITRFVLADINGLDPDQAVDLAEVMPAANAIVFEAVASQTGYLTPDKVVYSLAMDTSVGDFHFNWLGLLASDGTLVAVAYLPRTRKTATANGVQGNHITRNFLLQFADAQTATGIAVPAETWQIDLSAWLNAMDVRERESNRDIYGRASYFGDGWKLVEDAGSYQLLPGIGYVEGIRIVNAQPRTVAQPSAMPKEVCLDVSLQKQVDQVSAVVTVYQGAPADYVDTAGVQHYVEEIATIQSTGAPVDRRTVYEVGALGLVHYLLSRTNIYVPQDQVASPSQKGIVELATSAETQSASDTARAITPKALGDTVVDDLDSSSTRRPLSAAKGRALQQSKLDKTTTATTTRAGIVELATSAETQAAADTARAITPKGLGDTVVDSLTSTSTRRPLSAAKGRALQNSKLDKTTTATTTRAGIVERATQSEVLAKTDDTRYVSPKQLWAALNYLLPPNAVIFWHGTLAGIPEGWALCDGQNGRPNAIDRVFVCAGGEYQPGDTGGSDTRTSGSSGSHSHGASTGSAGSHTHSGETDSAGSHAHGASTADAGGHSHSASSSSAGNHAHTISVANHTLSTSRIPAHGHSINGVRMLRFPGYEFSNYGPDYDPNDRDGLTVTGKNEGGGGAHSHSASSSSTGAHSHSVSVAGVGHHKHSVTVSSGGTHSHDFSTRSAGGHSHSVSIHSGGSHSHSVDVRQRYFAAAAIIRVA
ncbi:phage tail-collar fiber domain-containing protein [Microbulbifer spongiae]|uniref:Phage tail protein n=1 Tax=Microbulbifer spongiae TaxID=2944933 RepID=A0ABY9E8R1_9GAMM|nr:phage tail protein [Microbulbifer sp. MI-G]WKD48331.1 phage tail protein [Microbulbifer sp. MI-G]